MVDLLHANESRLSKPSRQAGRDPRGFTFLGAGSYYWRRYDLASSDHRYFRVGDSAWARPLSSTTLSTTAAETRPPRYALRYEPPPKPPRQPFRRSSLGFVLEVTSTSPIWTAPEGSSGGAAAGIETPVYRQRAKRRPIHGAASHPRSWHIAPGGDAFWQLPEVLRLTPHHLDAPSWQVQLILWALRHLQTIDTVAEAVGAVVLAGRSRWSSAPGRHCQQGHRLQWPGSW